MQKVLRPLVFHLTALPLGVLWFSLLVTAWATGMGLLVTLIGLPIVWATLAGVREVAAFEAGLARDLLGADVAAPPRMSGWRLWERLSDGLIWRAQAYLLARFVLGMAVAILLITLWGTALSLVAAPLYYWAVPDGIELGVTQVDKLWEASAVIPLGLLAALISIPVTRWSGTAWRVLAERLLPGAETAGRPLPAVGPTLRTTLWITGGLEALCLLLWALTGRTSPWPAWTALGLFLPVGIQLAVLARDLAPEPRLRGLYVDGGLGAVGVIVSVGAWLIEGHGYFWPVWVMIGCGGGIALHALLELGARSERTALQPRMDELTKSRAGVVDARDDELRRIERDLHDGAQARLVAVAMNLGLAEDRMDRDIEGARELVVEAQEQARTAIRELRDLARGIAPPVLSDRGLQAAVEALAVTSPLPVEVTGGTGPRLSDAIERAAYFVTAEALANAAKHSGATRVYVLLRRGPDRLVVEIADDGRGGAGPNGSGLAGLRQRVEAVDGRLEIESASGAGTIIRASLPCASS